MKKKVIIQYLITFFLIAVSYKLASYTSVSDSNILVKKIIPVSILIFAFCLHLTVFKDSKKKE